MLDGLQLFRIEDVLQDFVTVLENSIEVRPDQEFLNKLSSRYCINHLIASDCSSLGFGKSVFMHPRFVGTSGLLVNEAYRRLPHRDFALPTNRQGPQRPPETARLSSP